jgi:hypothetical protein
MPDSSPDAVVETDVVTVSDTTAAATPADTSETQGGIAETPPAAKAETMLDAVNAALKPKEDSPTSQTSDPAAKADLEDPLKAEAAEGEDEDLADDEFRKLGHKVQRRIKSFTKKLEAKDAEIGGLKPKATEYDKIVSNLSRSGLSNEDFSNLMEIGGLMVNDPAKALARLTPVLRHLQEQVGEILPDELAERVRQGYLTEADAKALNRSTADAQRAKERADKLTSQQEAEKAQRETDELVHSSLSAVESWEKQKASKDPDWHLKRTEVAEQVELAIVREAQKRKSAYFPTAEESVKLAEKALEIVNGRLKHLKPKPEERKPVNGSTSSRSKPAAKTTLDAINNALG